MTWCDKCGREFNVGVNCPPCQADYWEPSTVRRIAEALAKDSPNHGLGPVDLFLEEVGQGDVGKIESALLALLDSKKK